MSVGDEATAAPPTPRIRTNSRRENDMAPPCVGGMVALTQLRRLAARGGNNDDSRHAPSSLTGDAVGIEDVRVRDRAQSTDRDVIATDARGRQLVAVRGPQIQVRLGSRANKPPIHVSGRMARSNKRIDQCVA